MGQRQDESHTTTAHDPIRSSPTRLDLDDKSEQAPMDWSLLGTLIANYESDADNSCQSAISYTSNDHDGLTDVDSDFGTPAERMGE